MVHVSRTHAMALIEQALGWGGGSDVANTGGLGLTRISSKFTRTPTEAAALVLLAGVTDPAGAGACTAAGLASTCTFAQIVTVLTATD